MPGSITQEDNGTWTVVYDLGPQPKLVCTADGCDWSAWIDGGRQPSSCPHCASDDLATVQRRRQVRRRGFERKGSRATLDDPTTAEGWLHAQTQQLASGTHVARQDVTLGEFLDEWLAAVESQLSGNGYRNVEVDVRCHLKPSLGHVRLQQLTPPQIAATYATLAKTGGRSGSGLAPKTIRNVHGTLHRALEDAVRWRFLVRNPAADVDPPAKVETEFDVWTPDELRTFLESVTDHPLHAAWMVLGTTGMRRGEVLGLRWSDIDLDTGRVRVAQQLTTVNSRLVFKAPKTKKGRRTLALAPRTVAALRRRRRDQAAHRLAAGPGWQDTRDLVFTDETGAPIHPRQFSKWLAPLAKAAGVPTITVHEIRHTYATVMLASGKSPKLISERLGHSSISITYDRYAAWIPGMDEDVAAAGEELIFGAEG